MKTGKTIKCCPLCGGRIVVSVLYQCSLDYAMRRDGAIGNRYKRGKIGPMDASIAACENYSACGAQWEVDDFFVDSDRRFWDYKYCKEDD